MHRKEIAMKGLHISRAERRPSASPPRCTGRAGVDVLSALATRVLVAAGFVAATLGGAASASAEIPGKCVMYCDSPSPRVGTDDDYTPPAPVRPAPEQPGITEWQR